MRIIMWFFMRPIESIKIKGKSHAIIRMRAQALTNTHTHIQMIVYIERYIYIIQHLPAFTSAALLDVF